MYLLDTNVFIEAKNRYYRMHICPGFWDWVEAQFSSGLLGSIEMVWDEINTNDDELSKWSKTHKQYFIAADEEECQQHFSSIVEYVMAHAQYSEPNRSTFLGLADPLLIAKAKTINGIVVTHESLVPDNSGKIKIPNICKEFGVDYCNTFDLLDTLEAKFVLDR